MIETLTNPTTNQKVQEFDNFFVSNYDYLKGFTRSIDVKYDYESLLQDVYIKIRCRIASNGFEGDGYLNFTRVALMNTYKTNYRNKKVFVDYDDGDHSSEIESILQCSLLDEDNTKAIENEMSYINTNIYDYVDHYFNEKERFIFKTYFLLKGKKLNYQQLSTATNYSITSVSNIIKRIKKELRLNIKTYINTGMNIEELKAFLPQVEALLKTDVHMNYNNYQAMYKTINGCNWSGCSCQKNALRESILSWYNKNKI